MIATGVARGPVPLVAVERGDTVESVHLGSVAVVDVEGRLVASAGDPDVVTWTRSALKPLQALPFVAAGGPARFGFDEVDVTLMCASHSGEARHQAVVASMLARAGLAPSDLGCGTHAPYVYDSLGESPPPPPYSPLGHNCSGKHAGMLACCVLHGWPTASYLDPEHPLQAAIRSAVARRTGVDEIALVAGIDGCSAPNYAMPLAGLARAYAGLARPASAGADAAALETMRGAMTRWPEYLSGPRRGDLLLARAGRGDWVAKVGAEGVQAIGIASAGLGVAIKVADGAGRAVLPAALAVLDALGVLDRDAREALAAQARPVLHNARGRAVGRIVPRVALVRAESRAGG